METRVSRRGTDVDEESEEDDGEEEDVYLNHDEAREKGDDNNRGLSSFKELH